jgi:hypothetical protein
VQYVTFHYFFLKLVAQSVFFNKKLNEFLYDKTKNATLRGIILKKVKALVAQKAYGRGGGQLLGNVLHFDINFSFDLFVYLL